MTHPTGAHTMSTDQQQTEQSKPTPCEQCDGRGWIGTVTETAKGHAVVMVERCDGCERIESDMDAAEIALDEAKASRQLAEQRGELREALEQVIAIGRSLSNACYNAAQGDRRLDDPDQQRKLKLLVDDWDNQVHAAREALASLDGMPRSHDAQAKPQ